MNKNMKKGTLIIEYLGDDFYAFHIILNINEKKRKMNRLEFLKDQNENYLWVVDSDTDFFDKHDDFNYKYINKG